LSPDPETCCPLAPDFPRYIVAGARHPLRRRVARGRGYGSGSCGVGGLAGGRVTEAIEADRYPLSPRVQVLRRILAKFGPIGPTPPYRHADGGFFAAVSR